MKLLAIATIALSVSLNCGCVRTTIKTPDGVLLDRFSVGYQAQFKSIKYDSFEVEGYEGQVNIDKLIDALGALR